MPEIRVILGLKTAKRISSDLEESGNMGSEFVRSVVEAQVSVCGVRNFPKVSVAFGWWFGLNGAANGFS